MKRGKEIKVENYTNYRVSVGTVDTKANKSIYIKINAWAEPIIGGELDYGNIIKNILKEIKTSIFNSKQNQFINDKVIVDFDMRESGIVFGKPSFMGCEITLFQLDTIPITDERTIKNATQVIDDILVNVLDNNKYFKFRSEKDSTV